MKKNSILFVVLIIATAICFQTASAQFNIKIPKILKPKKEEPKPEQPTTNANPSAPNEAKTGETRPAQQTKGAPNLLDNPEPNGNPQILLETLEIKAHNKAEYNPTDVPSWFPQVK